jgi:hypothetical protein
MCSLEHCFVAPPRFEVQQNKNLENKIEENQQVIHNLHTDQLQGRESRVKKNLSTNNIDVPDGA